MSVSPGDAIGITYFPAQRFSLEPEDIPLDILYEDDDVLVVNKSRGMVVHPAIGHPTGTLVNAFLFHCHLTDANFNKRGFRPGIVHRLDKDTSGVIILAKNDNSLNALARQFRERETEKTYLAVVEGIISQGGEVRGCIRRSSSNRVCFVHDERMGRAAHSLYTPLAHTSSPAPATLMQFRPITGRTHQLRVHATHLGRPILGDPLYNPHSPVDSLMLHAASLRICLPGREAPATFTAPPPPDMRGLCADYGLSAPLQIYI